MINAAFFHSKSEEKCLNASDARLIGSQRVGPDRAESGTQWIIDKLLVGKEEILLAIILHAGWNASLQ